MFVWRVKEGIKWCLRFLLKVGLIGGAGYAIFMAGAYFNPIVTYAEKQVKIEVEREAPVMDRIAGCESEGDRKSKGSHFDKNGQVRTNANKNGSVDIGKYQINLAVWGKTAHSLGYELTKEKDNEAFAMWLYANKGTEPWYSSESCWK